jgi:hypothetical protein
MCTEGVHALRAHLWIGRSLFATVKRDTQDESCGFVIYRSGKPL